MSAHDWTSWFQINGQRLASCLSAAFPWMDQQTIQDWVQHALLIAMQSNLDPTSIPFSHVWIPVKNDVLDWLRRRERESLVAFDSQPDGGWHAPDLNQHEPPSLVLRREKETRREKLVSDVLRDFTAESETLKRFREHEVMERSLRGESRSQIAQELGLEIGTVYTALSRANQRLMKHVAHKDVRQSISTTFHSEASNHASLVDLIRWTIEQAGAMCPSPKRLEQFLHQSESQQRLQTDLWFHVRTAKCTLCATLSSVAAS